MKNEGLGFNVNKLSLNNKFVFVMLIKGIDITDIKLNITDIKLNITAIHRVNDTKLYALLLTSFYINYMSKYLQIHLKIGKTKIWGNSCCSHF